MSKKVKHNGITISIPKGFEFDAAKVQPGEVITYDPEKAPVWAWTWSDSSQWRVISQPMVWVGPPSECECGSAQIGRHEEHAEWCSQSSKK